MMSDGVSDVVLFRFDHWCVNLDLGGGWSLGLKRGERADEKERRKGEKRREIMKEKREKFQELKSRIKY